MGSPSKLTGVLEKEHTGFRRMNGHSRGEVISVRPPFQMELNHVVDWNVMIDWKNMKYPDGCKCSLLGRTKSATALSLPKRERKVRAVTCV